MTTICYIFLKRQFNALYSPNDYDLLYIFKDFHRQLYAKARLVMQSICGRGTLKYILSLFYNTNKRCAFKFTDEIMYIKLSTEYEEDYDLYDIGFCDIYSKCILKCLIFEDILNFFSQLYSCYKPVILADMKFYENIFHETLFHKQDSETFMFGINLNMLDVFELIHKYEKKIQQLCILSVNIEQL